MPLYEYQCSSCNKTHEEMQKFSDPPLEKCPDCGGPVSKLMSRSSFALKGAGWYTTDYKRAGAPKAEGEKAEGAKVETAPASESKSSEAKPAEGKTETKTAETKAEAKPTETKAATKTADPKPGVKKD